MTVGVTSRTRAQFDSHGFRGEPLEKTETLDEKIEELLEHDAKVGLGEAGKERLRILEELQEAEKKTELHDWNHLRDELAEVEASYVASLDNMLNLYRALVEEIETLSALSRRREPLRSRALQADVPVPVKDDFGTRILSDHELRSFHLNRGAPALQRFSYL
jgi:hypothetical protein